MNIELIKLFNAALADDNKIDFASMNALATSKGYIVVPEACTASVKRYLETITTNPNATFYKTWNDIVTKSRWELFVDQLLHYMTTYGTDFSLGNGYVPNDGPDFVPAFKEFKVINVISPDELYDRCLNLLTSGVALKQNTMMVVADYVIDNIKKPFDIDAIKNKEAQVYLSDRLGIYPNDPNSLLRYIVYKTTGSTMLIKDKKTINLIKHSETPFDFGMLSDSNMVALATCFLRYKPIFLAFKQKRGKSRYSLSLEPSSNAVYINKLRRMANKYHVPMKPGFWQNIFNINASAAEINKHMNELTTYKKVALMQACLDRATAIDNQFYLVRNQKAFLREGYKPSVDIQYLMTIYAMLRMSLIDTLKAHSTKEVSSVDPSTGEVTVTNVPLTVKTVNGMTVSLPSSEKSFIGNYPFGTSYKMSNNNYFGVYWRNEWGTRDYDLSFVGFDGRRIGWNTSYYSSNLDIVFSGDMTNASPEAAEVLFIRKNCPQGFIKVNQFSGNRNFSKFQFFFGQDSSNVEDNPFDRQLGYLVDPNTIKTTVDVEHSNQAEISVGVCTGDEIVLMAIGTGNGITSNNTKHVNSLGDAIIHKAKCFVNAADILAEAGYNVVDETYTGEVDIDFKNLDKDSLIALMA